MTTTESTELSTDTNTNPTAIPTETANLAEGSGGSEATPTREPLVGERTQHKRYLLGFMPQVEAAGLIANELGEVVDLAQLKDVWFPRLAAANALRRIPIVVDDNVHAAAVQQVPDDIAGQCDEALAELAAQKNFCGAKLSFHMVRIDDLIILQNSVTLERARRLVEQLPPNPSAEELLRVSLGRKRDPSTIKHRWNGNNSLVFTSDDHDVRPLNPEVRVVEKREGEVGTSPAVVIPIAEGEPTIHCVRTFTVAQLPDGSVRRVWFLTLRNGVHRVFALRERGVEFVPMLVIDPTTAEETSLLLGNWSPERRQQGESGRPPLLRDFFNDDVAATFELPRTKVCIRIEVKIEKFQV